VFVTLLAVSLLILVMTGVGGVRQNLDAMPEPLGLDHDCKPLIRLGLKKNLRFVGSHATVSFGGEQLFWCSSPDHEKNPVSWLKFLEFNINI